MPKSSEKIEVALEIGKKRVFASALDWPGWSRSGSDEGLALDSLCASGPRYAGLLQIAGMKFQAPTDSTAFVVIERLDGNPTTDFGAPGISPSSDDNPVSEAELKHFLALMKAYWQAFDTAILLAAGKELSKGPRGGGRELEQIIEHVLGADAAYLRRIGWKFKLNENGDPSDELGRIRVAIAQGLSASVHGELPAQGPRGGAYWTPRYFVRRSGWHVLDHTWEIEDRIS
jgi:hypothetical protein